MLKETACAADRQKRRWFSDDYFDLFVWIDEDETISGFQLCYDKNHRERALTWTRNKGYSHERVDDGEANPDKDRTPVLVPDGLCPVQEITALFLQKSPALEHGLRSFVLEKLEACDTK